MEGRKQGSSSSSSLTNDLFGSKESSSSGIFSSIFAPPSKVLGREVLRSESMEKKLNGPKEAWDPKIGAAGDFPKSSGSGSQDNPNRDMSSMYQDQRVQPCHLSSSIYYGGQDVFSLPQNYQGADANSVYKKDDGEDDNGSASRGNWWQGSLYY